MYDRFTPTALEALLAAHDQAVALGHDRLTTGHLLVGASGLRHDDATRALREYGVHHAELVRALEACHTRPVTPPREVGYTGEWFPTMIRADAAARKTRERRVGVEHLLIAALETPRTHASQLLAALCLDRLVVLVALHTVPNPWSR